MEPPYHFKQMVQTVQLLIMVVSEFLCWVHCYSIWQCTSAVVISHQT